MKPPVGPGTALPRAADGSRRRVAHGLEIWPADVHLGVARYRGHADALLGATATAVAGVGRDAAALRLPFFTPWLARRPLKLCRFMTPV